jgi:uncharacterized protein YbjT (DUF2867 family)
MYAITGITGKVGGELARNLLAAGLRVRAIVRNASKGKEWAALGCEVALANMEDGLALADAFAGATATFILPPSFFRDFVDRTQLKRELTGRRLAALIQGGPPIVVDRSHAVP